MLAAKIKLGFPDKTVVSAWVASYKRTFLRVYEYTPWTYLDLLNTKAPATFSLQTFGPKWPTNRGQALAKPSRLMISGTRV